MKYMDYKNLFTLIKDLFVFNKSLVNEKFFLNIGILLGYCYYCYIDNEKLNNEDFFDNKALYMGLSSLGGGLIYFILSLYNFENNLFYKTATQFSSIFNFILWVFIILINKYNMEFICLFNYHYTNIFSNITNSFASIYTQSFQNSLNIFSRLTLKDDFFATIQDTLVINAIMHLFVWNLDIYKFPYTMIGLILHHITYHYPHIYIYLLTFISFINIFI